MEEVKKTWMALVIVSALSLSLGVGAEVHHIVGGDQRQWDPYTDIGSWSSGRTFRAGDKIWFTHSAAQGKIAEVGSKEEYVTCDVSNPIKMYTDDTDGISLEGEGIRYFTSSNPDKCKNGLKLHVEVIPKETVVTTTAQVTTSDGSDKAIADPPEISASAHVGTSFAFYVAGFWLCYMGI